MFQSPAMHVILRHPVVAPGAALIQNKTKDENGGQEQNGTEKFMGSMRVANALIL